jgi:signal transduction histidine kinase
MSAAWPLDARDDDDIPLPAPWDGDVDLSDPATEAAYLVLKSRQPALALGVCRSAYLVAQAKGDEQAAVHALYLACAVLYNTSQRALADRVFGLVRQRALGMSACGLSVRIEILHARQVDEKGEHAQAMTLRQRALETAMALGDSQIIFIALGSLSHAALVADDAELALSLCQQQEWYLPHDDIRRVDFRSNSANAKALALLLISRTRGFAGDPDAARRALRRARVWALVACASAQEDRSRLHHMDSLVQILLESGDAARAQYEIERWTARLAALPAAGSELWFVLQVARAHVDVHNGAISPQTLEALAQIDALPHDVASDLHPNVGDARQLLLRALEQLGRYEEALACHKRFTEWMAQHRSAQARQRTKALRQTVLAMRAEAMEFVTHDLLTPLPSASAPALRSAQRLLADAAAFSAQYLCCLRAELMRRTQLQRLDIGALADDVCENSVPAPSSGVRLSRTIDIGTPVLGDAVLLTKALAALLADAFDRAPAGTQVDLSLAHDAHRRVAVLSIGHDGSGPQTAARMRLRQRLFDDGAVAGVPFGLALAATVCRLHGIRLRFDDRSGRSRRIRLTMKTAAVYGGDGVALTALLHDSAALK